MRRALVAVSIDFGLRAAAGLVLASPLVAAVAGTGIPHFPAGDRLLFEPGGLLLVEVARSLLDALAPLLQTELVTGLVLALALLVPYSLVLVTLSRDVPASNAELWGRALARVPALLSVKGIIFLAQVAVALVTFVLGAQLRAVLVSDTSRGADLLLLGVVAVGGLVVLGLGVVRDLASAASTRRSLGGRRALTAGMAALRRLPGSVARGVAGPLGAGVALVALAAGLVELLDVGQPGAWRLGVVLLVHQAVILGLAACRAHWLGRALELVEATETEAAGG